MTFWNETTIKLTENLNDSNEKKWIKIAPSLHALLGHSSELIGFNENCGLGDRSEQGIIENNNKFLRFCRRHLARTTSQSQNLVDCFTRLWLQSAHLIRNAEPGRHKTIPKSGII